MNENRIELFVNSTNGVTIGQLDLYGDEPISLTLSVQDIKDISKRTTTHSQNFIIPANKNNNTLLNHIFNIGYNGTFDPTKKTPAYLNVNGLLVFKGNLQLTKINVKDTTPISYEVILYSNLADLIKSVGDKLLTDYDYSDLNHDYTIANIMGSWTADTKSLGYYYPLIDFGYDLTTTDLNQMVPPNSTFNGVVYPNGGIDPTIFKPSISSKHLFDKIINNAGFSYESEFLNSEAFTATITPFNGDSSVVNDTSFTNGLRFKAGITNEVLFSANTGNPYYNTSYGNLLNYGPKLDNLSDSDYGDNSGGYNPSTYKYVVTTPSVQEFGADIVVSFNQSISSYSYVKFKWYRKLGVNPAIKFEEQVVNLPLVIQSGTTYTASTITTRLDQTSSQYFYPPQQGEEFYFEIDILASSVPVAPNVIKTTIHRGTNWYNVVYPNLCLGGVINFNNYIPKKVKSIDVLKSYINMFNLLIIPKKNSETHFKIEPRDDYYASGIVKDWTSKLDLSVNVIEELISEQQTKRIKFTYSEDKDYLNTFYTNSTKEIYGEYVKLIDNEWLDSNSEQKIEIAFAPSPLENLIGSEEIILTKIGQIDSSGAYGKTDHKIRFLRKNLINTQNDTLTMLGYNPQYSYPYAGHLSSPFSSDFNPLDYNFGTISEAFYQTPGYSNLQNITPNNLINTYWRNQLDDISDKDSKIIKCNLHLTPADIEQFEFNDTIFIDGLTPDGGHYFNVLKITYTPNGNGTSQVELIKVNRKPKQPQLNLTKKANKNTVLRNVIALGGGITKSKNTIVMGNTSQIGYNSEFSFVSGENNIIGNNSSYSRVTGNNNRIGDNITNSYFVGDNNIIEIPSGSTVSGVVLIGVSNYSAATLNPNTVYLDNIETITTTSSLNGISMSAITKGATLWTSGTGLNSIRANNYTTSAGGDYSHAEGYLTTADGDYSHAEGYNTTAGHYSHAEGYFTTADGHYSHAEGYLTTADGDYSHAEGYGSRANGSYSYAGGRFSITTINGERAYSSGRYGKVTGTTQHGTVDFKCFTGNNTPARVDFGGTFGGIFNLKPFSVYRFKAYVIGSEYLDIAIAKEWTIEGLICNTSISGTTFIGVPTVTSSWGSPTLSSTNVGVVANNFLKSLDIEVTGLPSTAIIWYGKMDYILLSWTI